MKDADALIASLTGLLGASRVVDCRDADVDPRTAQSLSGENVGRPACWVRPHDTEEVAGIVRRAAEAGAPIVPVGHATTYWGALRVEGAVALDTLGLTTPLSVDPERRTAHVGAGVSVRYLDGLARAQGLCVAAYPDTDGETSLGSIVAVGSAAGLGMGRALPIELVTAATVVTGEGRVLRLGTSHRLHGRQHLRGGLPDLLGTISGAQGRGGIVTEVGLLLHPAPYLVRGQATWRARGLPSIDALMDLLAVARRGLDGGNLDTFRIEIGAEGQGDEVGIEVMIRCWSPHGVDEARARLEPLLRDAAPTDSEVRVDAEPSEARDGDPAFEAWRYSMPPGSHRGRNAGGAFWGADVMVAWGQDLRAAIMTLMETFEALGDGAVTHRRLGFYPAHHAVNVGLQVMGHAGDAAADRLVSRLQAPLARLLEAGGVPYRPGRLWRAALEAPDGGCETSRAAVDSAVSALDPDGVLDPGGA